MANPSPKARIRPLAAADLEEIVRYLDLRSEDAGDRFLDEFTKASQLLAEMPRLGTVRCQRGRLKGVRSWPLTSFGPYLIFYFPLTEGIDVLRVYHAARDVEKLLRRGLQ
jgi:toxin ParE1/3/4